MVRWFERLDDLGNRFEEWLWAIASNILETVREGNGGTIVRLLKIIEVEGKEDQKVGLTSMSMADTMCRAKLTILYPTTRTTRPSPCALSARLPTPTRPCVPVPCKPTPG